MKKILIAMDNDVLLTRIKKCGKYTVHNYDITTKEDVIEYVEKQDVDVIITKDTLNGNITKEEYIRRIREKGPNIKIIMCVRELTEEYSGFLYSKNIFNIIEGEEAKFIDIINMIDSKEKLIIFNSGKNNNTEKRVESTMSVVTKQKVCVFGTSGSGKSYVASLLGQITSRKLKLNTLMVDMDIQNAAMDIYNNLNNAGNNLQYVMEEIDRGSFNSQMLQEIISKEKRKNGKLSFITNNMGIYECQNKFSKEYYEQLYDETESKYDLLILDLPATPFLDVVPYTLRRADKVFFVINPNFISIRQGIKYLDLLTNIWKIPIEKIYLVINKIKKDSLDIKQIKAILKDYKICMKIPEDNKVEAIINGIEELNICNVDKVEKVTEIANIFVNKSNESLKVTMGDKHDN